MISCIAQAGGGEDVKVQVLKMASKGEREMENKNKKKERVELLFAKLLTASVCHGRLPSHATPCDTAKKKAPERI